MENLLQIINNFSPLGVAALALFALIQSKQIKTIKTNHLPHIQDTSSSNGEKLILVIEALRDTNDSLRRIEGTLISHSNEEMRLMNKINLRITKLESNNK